MCVLKASLSDIEIKRHLNNKKVKELNDDNSPLRLRYNKNRSGASWFFVFYHRGLAQWKKIGSWPLVSFSTIKPQLPFIAVRLLTGTALDEITIDHFNNVSDLLEWHKQRLTENKNLSQSRKINSKSVIDKHLLPALEGVKVSEINRRLIDKLILWPLQKEYKLNTVKTILMILKSAFSSAYSLDLISVNPMAAIKFKDSIKAKIDVKEGKLKLSHLSNLLKSLDGYTPKKTLVSLMLLCGTRISETRLARWDEFDLNEMSWDIPSNHTKSKRAFSVAITEDCFNLLKLHRHALNELGYCGPYVFPSTLKQRNKEYPLSRGQANDWIKDISKGGWTSHDLRKLAATIWIEKIGVDYFITKWLLNHSIERLDKTYLQSFVEPQKRKALEDYHIFLNDYKNKLVLSW